MMKLVCFLALFSAVAFAAPRAFNVDTIVPEELVQTGTSESVESLKKQFHELQMQLKDGSKATPGVIEVINDMVALIESDIEVAINDAHKADQDTLDAKMASIGDLNSAYSNMVAELNVRADGIEKLIADAISKSATWKAKSEFFTKTQNDYFAVYDNQTKTCCAKDNAGVIDVEYTPAYALCDYTVPAGAGCGARAVKAAADIVTTPFTDGLALWRALLFACNGLIVDLDAADVATDNAIADCDTAKKNTKAAEKITQDEKNQWSEDWDTTIANYNGNYTAMMADYDKTKARVVSDEIDRKNEWKATQEIKCMLIAYRDGGSFDDATHEKCSKGIKVGLTIDYPEVIAQLSWDKHVFTKFTDASAYESTCDARTPAPEFTCVVAEPRPYPECVNHM
jgi:hypothetical protein